MSEIGLLINTITSSDHWLSKEVQESGNKIASKSQTQEEATAIRLTFDEIRRERRVKALKRLVEYLAQHPKGDERAYEYYSYDYVQRFVDAHVTTPPPAR